MRLCLLAGSYYLHPLPPGGFILPSPSASWWVHITFRIGSYGPKSLERGADSIRIPVMNKTIWVAKKVIWICPADLNLDQTSHLIT
jgi:hypothetical protein